MEIYKVLTAFCILQLLICCAQTSLFSKYIGTEYKGVKLSDVPLNSNVEFHLSFAIVYTISTPLSPAYGEFNVFWDSDLTPDLASTIKSQHPNTKIAVSLGGDSIEGQSAFFEPSSIDSWVSNAVSSLTDIIQQYNLDGIDIDYEHFHADPHTFAECIGQLISTLKNNSVISFASIAKFDNDDVQRHYEALWESYGHVIDYVNFQFYAYDSSTTVDQFLEYFDKQSSNYKGGKILASFSSDGGGGGLSQENGFFQGCSLLKNQGKLGGIFVWDADSSIAQVQTPPTN